MPRPSLAHLDLVPLAAAVPGALWRPALAPASRAASARPPAGLRQWQRNAAIVLGRQPTRGETAAAAESWARNLMESVQLHRVSPVQALQRVHVDAERAQWLRDRVLERGAVVALPHQGSWDLSGAWACAFGMPVHTVAERLSPREYQLFAAARSTVGMTVLAHDDPRAIPKLLRAAREHNLVCLVTDRAIAGTGTVVAWPSADGPEQVRIPVGAALVAQRSGVPLVPASSRFTPGGIDLEIGEEIATGAGAEGVQAANQQLASWFASRVRDNVVDWHMLQPFFGLVGEQA